jgi:glycerol-1-phosphate dehydrogenase [NAD(P)+]
LLFIVNVREESDMQDLLKKVEEAAKTCPCGRHEPITVEKVDSAFGAVARLAAYIGEKGWKTVGVVSDEVVRRMIGGRITQALGLSGASFTWCTVLPDEQGDVIADERSIVQVMVELPDPDVFVVLGSGTLHDIVRFASSRMRKPFISVPTAPSVDGFTSAGAPIVVRGFKQTIQTGAPVAVFADPAVFADAPRPLAAAGFADMIGKHTSLFDWKFGHVTGGEPYCPAVAELTREALEMCEGAADSIARGQQEGLSMLMDALLLSGLSMLLFGASHPASGAEHHLSHDWEMELLRRRDRQLLHGAKVGVACAIMADRYKNWAPEVRSLGEPKLVEALEQVPAGENIRALLRRVGGSATPQELGVDSALVEASLHRAHTHRNRATLLRWHNER